ncbi:uncharacterized protein LOC124637719 isoform X1 [Helicoverpa zea]|uniref:uncharacterized protein LOC124637719 isoform X1 n=1 Tax=Helicoverpa zea TaxID=7113 RepID=UPI001F5A1970|nr:uncharacterized protein LOC124637719 isoform X1 [Helicoverpa zea]
MKTQLFMKEFIDFLESRALARENAMETMPVSTPSGVKPGKPACNTAAAVSCKYCNTNHRLYMCAKFKLAADNDKGQFVKKHKLCIVCLNAHGGKCKLRLKCSICQQRHNTLLHGVEMAKKEASNVATASSTATVPCADVGRSDSAVAMSSTSPVKDVLLPTAIVRIITKNGTFIHARALLDTGSQVSFITEKLADQIDCKITPANQLITGILQGTSNMHQRANFDIYAANNNFKLALNCYIAKNITCELPQQSFYNVGFNIPSHVYLADKNFNKTGEISLLLGCDVFFQVLQSESLPLTPQGPYLVSTSLGYIVAGSLPVSVGNIHSSNFCVTVQGTPHNISHNSHNDQLDSIEHTISNFWKCEKVPEIYKEGITEHQLAEECFQNSVKLVDGKFCVDLPLKLNLNDIQMGNSFNQALHRFHNLERRFAKDDKLYQQYKKFIHVYLEQGHAMYFDISNYDPRAGNVYFLPHHPVINLNSKTTPVRAVFDASMKTNKGICLNDMMLNGPVVQNDLFDILTLFRSFKYVLLCDIKAMYRGILVSKDHCCLQNILWRDSVDQSVQCLQLQTVTYGLKSSAFLATRCLIELAERYQEKYPLASFVLKYSTYVDDVLCGSNDILELVEIKRQLIELLSLASFSLHKWCSNNTEILDDIPIEIHQLNKEDFDKTNTFVKTLGLSYDVTSDTLNMKCPSAEIQKPSTKRQMLSFISKFFDPLGLVGPILVQAKYLMQQVWFEKLKWDDILPDSLNKKFLQFVEGLMNMSCISVPRNINVYPHKRLELVGYADASNIAHGCCLYLRVVRDDNTVNVNLLCSKSRINPKDKTLTIPRLELNSALLLAKLARKVHDTLAVKYNYIPIYLYLDSKIVLSRLMIEAVKLTAYVVNRI